MGSCLRSGCLCAEGLGRCCPGFCNCLGVQGWNGGNTCSIRREDRGCRHLLRGSEGSYRLVGTVGYCEHAQDYSQCIRIRSNKPKGRGQRFQSRLGALSHGFDAILDTLEFRLGKAFINAGNNRSGTTYHSRGHVCPSGTDTNAGSFGQICEAAHAVVEFYQPCVKLLNSDITILQSIIQLGLRALSRISETFRHTGQTDSHGLLQGSPTFQIHLAAAEHLHILFQPAGSAFGTRPTGQECVVQCDGRIDRLFQVICQDSQALGCGYHAVQRGGKALHPLGQLIHGGLGSLGAVPHLLHHHGEPVHRVHPVDGRVKGSHHGTDTLFNHLKYSAAFYNVFQTASTFGCFVELLRQFTEPAGSVFCAFTDVGKLIVYIFCARGEAAGVYVRIKDDRTVIAHAASSSQVPSLLPRAAALRDQTGFLPAGHA